MDHKQNNQKEFSYLAFEEQKFDEAEEDQQTEEK
jgi:hypothetical protein